MQSKQRTLNSSKTNVFETPVIKLIYITLIIMAVASCKNGSRQQSTTTTQDSIAIESEGIKSLSEQIEKILKTESFITGGR
jgi:hypothetical protein